MKRKIKIEIYCGDHHCDECSLLDHVYGECRALSGERLGIESDGRARRLIQGFLKDTIISQERWGRFLVEQTISEIDKHDNVLQEYFLNPRTPDLARVLWEKSPAARLNWYSSLEILGPDLDILSRFSLNVPRVYGAAFTLAGNSDWAVVRRTISFIGKERDFFIAYRDWEKDGAPLGRVILYLSIDPEMLPFLYDALSQVISALDPDAEAYQVKEKFGGLRFYCDGDGRPDVQAAIFMAEAMSDRTCEVCGTTENVTQNDGGWITTRCETCRGDDERPVARGNWISKFFRSLWEV